MLGLQGLVLVGNGRRAPSDVVVGKWQLGPFSPSCGLAKKVKRDVAQNRIEGMRCGPRFLYGVVERAVFCAAEEETALLAWRP